MMGTATGVKGMSKWRGFYKKIGFRIFIIVFLCAVLQVSAVGFFSYNMSRSMMEKSIRASASQTISETADKLDLVFRGWEDKALQLLSDYNFIRNARSYFSLPESSLERPQLTSGLNSQLSSLVNLQKGIMSAYLVPMSGEKSLSIVTNKGVADMPSQPWLAQVIKAEGNMVWIETSPEHPLGFGGSRDPIITGARWIRGVDDDPKHAFVLVMEIRRSGLENQVGKLKLGNESQTAIVDASNKIVYASNGKVIGQPFGVDVSGLQQELTPAQATQGNTASLTDDHVEKLASFVKLPASGWTLAIEAPKADLLKDTNRILKFTLWMALGAIVVTAVIGFIIIRYIGNPIIGLRNLMKRAEQGDLTVQADTRRADEIGELSTSFNQMIQEVAKLVQQTAATSDTLILTGREVLQVSKQTSISASEIAVATAEIAKGSETLATEAEKSSDLTQDIRQQMETAAEQSREMAESSLQMHAQSGKGVEYMSTLSDKTAESKSQLERLVAKVGHLSESASSMTGLLHMLQEIAKQTNILSLNAAIEATRAGASGKGFMVVADEIRQLAERSRLSIEQAGVITESIGLEIGETVESFSSLYPVFQAQLASVADAEAIFVQVQGEMEAFVGRTNEVTGAIGALEQSQGVLQTTMSNVSAVSQQSSATSEEVASLSDEQLGISNRLVELSEQLEQLSVSLQDSLRQFKY